LTLSNAIDAAAAAAEAVLADHSQALAAEHAESVRASARAAAVTANAVLASPSAARAPARRIGGARRRRTPMTLDTKLRVIGWHAADRTIDYISRQLDNQYDRSGLYKIIMQKDSLLSRAAEGAAGGRFSSRAGQYPEVDKALLKWFLAVHARGRKRLPLSLAILRQKALQVAQHLGITDIAASSGFIQRCASCHCLENVALHGSGASANVEEAAERMVAIRQQLEGVDVDLIYNVDETGLLYRGLPSRSYVPSEDLRTARGSKAMKSKDRVTLNLCYNATGTHKVPVTMIGKAAQPMCFQGESNASPLPHLSQKSAWTDASAFKRWFEEVFVPAVQARTAHHFYLIMDNLGCHSSISHPQVTIIELPPNTTALYQPLDAGIIVLRKNRYKKRLLYRVVCNLDSLLYNVAADPRVARGGVLNEGGQAHLRDAAKFIVEDWDEILGDQIVRCWLKADCLPTEAGALLRLQLGDIQVVAELAHMDVSHLVAMMANTSLEHEFDGLSGQEQVVLAVRRWLTAESDVEAIDQTVHMVLTRRDDE